MIQILNKQYAMNENSLQSFLRKVIVSTSMEWLTQN